MSAMSTELIPFVLPTKFSLSCGIGWGNGYVGIPIGHPCYGLHYDEIHARYPAIQVHGGLTYSQSFAQGRDPVTCANMWIVGFDTGHAYDSLGEWPDEDSVMAETLRLKQQLQALRFHKGLLYYVRLLVHAPIWYLYPDPEKKSWAEFKSGLISHKCRPDQSRIVAAWANGTTYRFRACQHYGCSNLFPIDVIDCDVLVVSDRPETGM